MILSKNKEISFVDFRQELLSDYRLACESREVSLLGRREVLTGKAKFGIFGDGKELAQIAMAKVFRKGDFRSGYYRDQTFMMAIGEVSIREMFAGLYGHTDVVQEPASAGRQMSGHYATRSLNEDGTWKDLMQMKNSSADISCTSAQMPRLLGLAQASKVYRNNKDLQDWSSFSDKGNEIAFGTIGDASTSEGLFFETINAAGVLQVPMIMSVWDDGYGISVPSKYQTTKESISEVLKGFQRDENGEGYEIFCVKGWDYPSLIETYQRAEKIAREEHVPCLIHVSEVTQPQGHSTSGSHERYKSKERLQWESDFDPIKKMGEWMTQTGIATQEDLDAIYVAAKKTIRLAKGEAWKAYINPIKEEQKEVASLLLQLAEGSPNKVFIEKLANDLSKNIEPFRKDIFYAARRGLRLVRSENSSVKAGLIAWLNREKEVNSDRFSSHLYSASEFASLKIEEVLPEYDDDARDVDARIIIRDNFDAILTNKPETLIFGEDSGCIGDVNQGLEGMQEKHGELRVSDTGIREATILGQGIGMALRGLRPIAEIQYLDYLLYAIQIMSDDLATLHYRTKGGQKAPLIVRTRGHRLEGIWHSGSPMGMIINSLRGVNILVPRNMTKAAGFYNTMLASDDPALIIECLNGYRLKEKMPSNLGAFRTPVGLVETTKEGTDVTLVTYGSTWRLVMEAARELEAEDISVEVIDIQSLIPFDVNHKIVESIAKTNRVIFIDEDVPGGATSYMMQKVLEEQKAYFHLDSEPRTLTAKAHRPAYGTDGDYFSKPSVDDIFEEVYEMMRGVDPEKYLSIY
ncbi:MAG: thiamine pyrophosphate-dependent enzyme [Flavobacteriales bacterium]|nr:thiamine pyrophosphate-dependent enzyme [Flavobacteriales bacterium]